MSVEEDFLQIEYGFGDENVAQHDKPASGGHR